MPAQVKFGGRKTREGTVVSDKMEKTVVVAVETHSRHPLYKKIIRRVKRYLAHNENGEAALGDRVRIGESQPISRRKRWRVVEVLTHVELPEVAPGAIDLELLGEVKTEEPVEEPAAVAVAEKAAAAPKKKVARRKAEEPVAEVPAEEAPTAEEPATEEAPPEEPTPEGEAVAEAPGEQPEPDEPVPEADAEPEAAPPEAEEESP